MVKLFLGSAGTTRRPLTAGGNARYPHNPLPNEHKLILVLYTVVILFLKLSIITYALTDDTLTCAVMSWMECVA